MTNSELAKIYEERKTELIEKTIEILPDALSGDNGNRTFYFEIDEEGNLSVDYYYYQGQIILDNYCFFTIKNYETPEPGDYGLTDLKELDFENIGYQDIIEEEINHCIWTLEQEINH